MGVLTNRAYLLQPHHRGDIVHPMHVVYLEHDGKVLLVDQDGNGPMTKSMFSNSTESMYRFPTVSEVLKLGIEFDEKSSFQIQYLSRGIQVTKAYPKINWPEHWIWKDEVFLPVNVHVIVKESIYRSVHRLVSKLIIHNQKNEVLMAKINRGHFKGYWSLPGGYMDHDEHPEEGCLRETFEELGLKLQSTDGLEKITQRVFHQEGISFVSFTYSCEWNGEITELQPLEEEIENVLWFPLSKAISLAVSHFDIEALQSFAESKK